MLDTQDYFDKKTCHGCGDQIALGCMVMGKCPYCRSKEEEHYWANRTVTENPNDSVSRKMEIKQIKRLQHFLRLGQTATGRSFTSRQGSQMKHRYEEYIRTHV